MNILIVLNTVIPAKEYGGTERVVWWLGKELTRRGHGVTYMAAPGSRCPFAKVVEYDPHLPFADIIPPLTDLVHLQFEPTERIPRPYLITHHGNFFPRKAFDINTVFVSHNHAQRNGASCYVYNGLDPDEYGSVDWKQPREHLLFLGYAKRPEKNLRDCAYIARKSGHVLAVIGGKDKWFKRRPWLRYEGFLGGEAKNAALRKGHALLFPVRWHEPFGLAVIESLYFGCPVIGSPYGSLPELVAPEVGFLSNRCEELVRAVADIPRFSRRRCHEYVCARFSVRQMTDDYLRLYEQVLSGRPLNPRPPVNGGNFSPKNLLPISR